MSPFLSLGRGSVRGGLLAAVMLGIGGVAFAGPPVATVTYDVDGRTYTLAIEGTTLPSGNVRFQLTHDAAPWQFTWDYIVDSNPIGNATFNGKTTVRNLGTTSAMTKTTFESALCPTIVSNSFFGGTAVVKLITDEQGGALTCGNGPHLTGVLVNGVTGFVFFWCPFNMAMGGGFGQTTANFGLPYPSLAGPPSVDTFGHFANLTLTPGETAEFTANVATQGQTSYMPSPTCPFDINGDGVVNKWDLIELLSAFGLEGACLAADLNGDGRVDAADLAMLLGNWGACPD